MLRKSLILGSITLLMVMLFAFTGCEGPVGPAGPAGGPGNNGIDGDDGPGGKPGGFAVGSEDVTEVELAAAFSKGDIVFLESSVKTVYGIVPIGKTLEVRGLGTNVKDGEALTINGVLDVSNTKHTAALIATGIPGTAGVLKSGGSGVIKGNGMVILPYIVSGSYNAGLSYDSQEIQSVTHYPGSVVTSNEDPVELNSSGIGAIFGKEDAISELTVWNIKNLEARAIPKDKTLILRGLSNTITTGVVLDGGASLVIAEGATLNVDGGALSVTEAGAVITNAGTINLRQVGDSASKGVNGKFDNNGIITSPTLTGGNIIRGLLELTGSGSIILSPRLDNDYNPSLTGNALLLNQNLIIEPILSDPTQPKTYTIILPNAESVVDEDSESGKIITLANEYAALELGTSSESIGTSIVNRGRVFTNVVESAAVDPDKVLVTLFEEMDNQGKVTVKSAMTRLTQPLVIPEAIELTLDNPATSFENSTGGTGNHPITVNGTLIIANVADPLQPDGDITVAGTLVIEADQRLQSNGAVTITGALNLGTGNGGTLTMVNSKILTLSSADVVLEKTPLDVPITGKIFVADTTDGITIGSVEDYGLASAGISGQDFAKAFKAISDSADILKTNLVTLDPSLTSSSSSFFGTSPANASPLDVVGTVEITTNTSAFLIDRDDNTDQNSANKVILPSGVEIYPTTGVAVAGTAYTAVGNLGDVFHFVVSVSGVSLAVTDDGYGTSTGVVWGIIPFTAVRVVHSNLVSPLRPSTSTSTGPWVEPFYVGIKSRR
jgi:hypothetical protein